jgi:hypothetical protein
MLCEQGEHDVLWRLSVSFGFCCAVCLASCNGTTRHGDHPPAEVPSERVQGSDAVPSEAVSLSTPGSNSERPHTASEEGYGDAEMGDIQFVDVSEATGVDFSHTDGGGEKPYIVQTVTAGLALLDYDNDGWIDVYFLNGSEVPGSPLQSPPQNRLYRNLGNWRFQDVTAASGVGDVGYGMGVVAGDYDEDGDPDLYVSNFGPNVLYRNNGDGTFENVTETVGASCDLFGAGVAFMDVNADSFLDLYVGNYVDFTYDNYISRTISSYEFPASPTDYEPLQDRLLVGDGEGGFRDQSRAAGLGGIVGPTMGVIATDVDLDRDVDIVVCCDNKPNFLLMNDGFGVFTDHAQVAGIAVDWNGGVNGSMGVDAADYDNDGQVDLYITNYQGELSQLSRNTGGVFSDTSMSSNASRSTMPQVKWGGGFVDFDLDGRKDLFVACGHFIKHIEYLDDRARLNVPNHVLRNVGEGRFSDVSKTSGRAMGVAASSRGAAFDDLDNDGDVDIVVMNANGRPTFLRNDTKNTHRSLSIDLIGHRSNREGIGARVEVSYGGTVQVAEKYAGRGYQSHYGSRLTFGLGPGGGKAADGTTEIRVSWIGGGDDVYSLKQVPRGVVQLHEGGGFRLVEPVGRLSMRLKDVE